MTLFEAIALRRELVRRTGSEYTIRRSARRSLGVTPFYVALGDVRRWTRR